MPSYLACMQHLKNRKLRETIYKAYLTRASDGEHNNTPVIQDILRKKRAIAKMLVRTSSPRPLTSRQLNSLGIPNLC
jgi:Zn-dependent oligopeptidase